MRSYPSLVLSCLMLCGLLVGSLASPLAAEEVLKPTKAYSKYLKEMRRFSGPAKVTEGKQRAEAYLEAWAASGKKPTPTDKYVLAQFQQAAEQYDKALAGFHAVQGDQEVKEKTRDYAAKAEAGMLLIPAVRWSLGADGIKKATDGLCAYAAALPLPNRLKARSSLRAIIAQVYDRDGRAKDAYEMRMQLIKDDPTMLSQLVRPIVRGFLRATHKLAEYDTVRAEAAKAIGTLRAMQEKVVADASAKYQKSFAKLKSVNPGALDAEGNLKQKSTRKMTKEEKDVYTNQRSLTGAEKLLADIAVYEKPLALLGQPAAAWTLETAFEELESIEALKGKVVVLDFFATMFDQCNFPIMRDLLKDYGEKGLAVVGVTITGSVVYSDRYPSDEDMKHKAEPGAQLYYAARLASEKEPADGEYILEESAYRLREQEAIKQFIENHELKWPVVMIDKTEPGPKYAKETWPHMVVLDKEGRIRWFRGGKLERTDKEEVAALRQVIDDLLAE